MFEHIKQAQEREASKDSQRLINSMKNSDYLAISHHVSSLIIAIIAFGMIMVAVNILEEPIPNPIIGYSLLAAVSLLILFHEVRKRQVKYLRSISFLIVRIKSFWIKHWYADYLAKYFWVSLFFLLSVITSLAITYFYGNSGWVPPEIYQSEKFASSVNMVITIASGLLAAQIALFSFMMQQVLSKYSGIIAQSVASHKVFKLLALFPIIGLLIPFMLHNFGAPKSLETLILPVIGFMLLVGLLFTVIVAKSGLRESLAVRYFGDASSKKISNAIPTPYKNHSKFTKYYWRALYFVGLDFRNKDRFQAINPPNEGAGIAMEALSAALGVANKAAVEGQHDVFVSSLISIESIMKSYAKRRELYISSEDEVFNYLNYQFAALIESTAKIPNQYLISNLTNSIGNIAQLTYSVGKIPEELTDGHRSANNNNFVTVLWMGLLVQCFEHTHTLTRSTAAHTSLRKISELACTSIINNDSDLITITYLPSIKKIFSLCIIRITDAYHKELAGQCIVNLMSTLVKATVSRSSLSGARQDPFEAILNSITELSNLYLSADPTPSINLNDPLNIILSKTVANQYCIQEIFFMLCNQKMDDSHSYRVAVSNMEKVVEEISNMGAFAINANVYTASYYLDALFEILYIVVRGLPSSFSEFDQQEEQEATRFRLPTQVVSTEQRLIELICNKLNELAILFHNSKNIKFDWQQSLYSSIGILIVRFADKQEVFIRNIILVMVQNLYSRIRSDIDSGNKTAYDSEKYLQLAAAWLNAFDVDDELVQEIVTFLSNNRGYCRGYGGSRERYGLFGYPTLQHRDFYISPLRNIRHPQIMTEEHWQNFNQLNDKLVNDDVLIPFANNIRELSEDRT